MSNDDKPVHYMTGVHPRGATIHGALSAMLDAAPSINVDRIRGDMTLLDAVGKLAGNNTGAIETLATLMNAASTLDPDSAVGPWSPLLSLDRCRLYGQHIYMLHHDVCRSQPVVTLACLRAVQLGYVPEAALHHFIATTDHAAAMACLDVVRKHLPRFGGAS